MPHGTGVPAGSGCLNINGPRSVFRSLSTRAWRRFRCPGPPNVEAVMVDPVIRRAEYWEGLDRDDILRRMSDGQLSAAATRLLQFERAASRVDEPNRDYLAACRRDVREIVTEMLRRGRWLEA
jgi:hypothetical protein